jgi:hypothetical protein
VGLVHRDHRDPLSLHRVQKSLVGQPLGSHVEQFERSVEQPLQDGAVLVASDGRVKPCRVDTPRQQEVDLVFHQRNQGRDHKRKTIQEQCRKLVADALSAAGGEDRHRATSIQ